MKKKVIKIISLIILFFLPFIVFISITESLPDQFSNTYLAELNDKYERLNAENDKKIVFVGGSSLPFGLRSDLLEQELEGYKVVNFGLYATLGTKLMMDFSKSNINAGDIVILSPELSEQTYSLYFNPNALLQACEGFSSKYHNLSFSENLSIFYNYYKYAKDKISYCAKNNAPDPIGIYRRDSFNEYGDISVDRPRNIMNNGVDSTMPVYINDSLLDDEFIDYVNSYCEFVRSRKAKIYFSFSPTNKLSVNSSKNMRTVFQQELTERLDCDLLLDIENCIIDYRYFYDTNFHLNSSGAIYYTGLLANALNNKINVSVNQQGTVGGVEIPKPPEMEEEPVIIPDNKEKIEFAKYKGEANNDYEDWFEYALMGNSYQIVGVKDEFKDMEEVILPTVHNNKNVTALTKDALNLCIYLKTIHIGTTFKTLEGFEGCIALEKIYLYEMDGNKITVPQTGLLNRAGRNARIYVPEGSNYFGGYTWLNYSDKFEYYTKE